MSVFTKVRKQNDTSYATSKVLCFTRLVETIKTTPAERQDFKIVLQDFNIIEVFIIKQLLFPLLPIVNFSHILSLWGTEFRFSSDFLTSKIVSFPICKTLTKDVWQRRPRQI